MEISNNFGDKKVNNSIPDNMFYFKNRNIFLSRIFASISTSLHQENNTDLGEKPMQILPILLTRMVNC